MSASSKKKLRNEQEAAKMTERQLKEQKEAKKLKIYTAVFAVVLAVIVIVAVCVGISRTMENSGIREKNTVAVTVGDVKLSNAELNYYYIDAINEFYSYYGSYASLFGLDVTKPLNEQITDEEAGTTWADDFIASAKSTAQSTIALAQEAEANGFALTEDQLNEIENSISSLAAYAAIYGYSDSEDYLKAIYGNGATIDSYREYCQLSYLASSYYSEYSANLSYEDADLRAAEEENYDLYTSYSYNTYYLNTSKFLEGGTTDEDGTTTYSEEEKNAAVAAAEEAANSLIGEETESLEDLDAAISALSINAESETAVTSTAYEDILYSSVTSTLREWITASQRKAGDMTVIANTSTSTDDEGNEVVTTNGYYVVYFVGSNDNTFALANVRHVLVEFEGGITDDSGNTTYTDEEKAAAMEKAEDLLNDWKAGTATEETFSALAVKNSADTGSAENGGLYENVYPGQMVENFENWCFAEGRKAGDTGIIETEYGCHIMYYVGDSDLTYRDYMITEDLRSADTSDWYNALVEAMTVTDGDTTYINKDLVLSAS